MPTQVDAGHLVAGRYELVRRLGCGSMGEVWVAHHRTLKEQVALKILSDALPGGDVEDEATVAARFRFEAQVAARLSRRTRHIVHVSDHGVDDDGLAYLVMELLEGETLAARLARPPRLALEEIVAIVAQMGRALTEAHAADVIHRDLKPANVFLTHDEDDQILVKLLDFGIARTVHTHRIGSRFATAQGLVFGTPGYMSPEQACPSRPIDPRCDLWALATLAYEALTGHLPVPGTYNEEIFRNLCAGEFVPAHVHDPTLPSGLASFFARAFARDIDARHASAAELTEDFACAVRTPRPAVSPAVPAPARGGEAAPRPNEGRPPRRWIAAAPVALLVGIAAVVASRHTVAAATARAASVPEPVAARAMAAVSMVLPDSTPERLAPIPEADDLFAPPSSAGAGAAPPVSARAAEPASGPGAGPASVPARSTPATVPATATSAAHRGPDRPIDRSAVL